MIWSWSIACPLLQNSNRKIQCSKSLFSVQRFHSMFKDSIQCSKIPFNVQRFHSMFKDFIQYSKISFNVQKFHSKFKDFIQCSIFSFKVQKVYSKFKKFIQSSKCSFKVQKAYSKFKNFYSIYKHKDIISFLWQPRQPPRTGEAKWEARTGALITIFKKHKVEVLIWKVSPSIGVCVFCGTKRNAEELSLFANLHVYFLFPREYYKGRFFEVFPMFTYY